MRAFLDISLLFWPAAGRECKRGYLDNTKRFIFWLCNMKQFFPERSKNGSKKVNIILFSISRSFWPFYGNSIYFRRFPQATEDSQRFPKRLQVLPLASQAHVTSVLSQADHPLLVGAVIDWNLSNDLLLFIEEIHMNNTVAIICSKMQNLKQIFQ